LINLNHMCMMMLHFLCCNIMDKIYLFLDHLLINKDNKMYFDELNQIYKLFLKCINKLKS
jgi:hypothetical protein